MSVGRLGSWVNKRVDTCDSGDATALHAPESIGSWGGEEGKAQGVQLSRELHFDILLRVYYVVVVRWLFVEVAVVSVVDVVKERMKLDFGTLTGRGCAGSLVTVLT